MKRSLILALCAVIVAALGITTAQADTNVALNLRYTDPADPNEGGTWTLVAKNDDPNSDGVTALIARFTDIDPNGAIDGSIGHDIDVSGGPFDGGATWEIVYGQDPNAGLTDNVGLVGGPSDQGADPLNNSAWDNASVIATGTFGSARPAFDPNNAGANFHVAGLISASTIGLANIRGDSVSVDGLLEGDANRDGTVDFLDFSTLSSNWQTQSAPPNEPLWDQGNFNDDDIVDFLDFSSLSGNWQGSSTPPAIGAVPEPASMVLFSGCGIAALFVRRRR